MKKLSYEDVNGNTIFTSQYFRNRGSCCKSGCLHCPYGYTLKTIGVKVSKIGEDNNDEAKKFFKDYIEQDAIASNLLANAFGGKQAKKWDSQNYLRLTLKGYFCGLVEINNGEYQKHHLRPEFRDQGINDAYIRSLL